MTIKYAFGAMRLAHISVAFVGLMWVLPFLVGYHPYPISTFFQEWGAFALGLCAMPLLVTQRYWLQPVIPRVVVLPLGLTLLVLVQYALGKVTYFSQALLFSLYMLWAALLIMLGQRLREELGLPALVTSIAAFLLLGAELNALIGIVQHYNWRSYLDYVVMYTRASTVFGNFAQPNHFANFISLGLISLGLLHASRRLHVWQVGVLAMPLLFVLTLSGSRSPWIYLLGMVCMALFWQRRDKSNRPLLHYSLLLVLGFILMHGVVQIPWLAGYSGTVTSGENLFNKAAGSNVRLHLWHGAWLIFTRFPLLGAGYGQFPWQYFQLAPALHYNDVDSYCENAHNLVLQIAAEMGLAGLLILMGTLTLWLLQARSAQRGIYHWWGYCLLGVLAIHSMLEYPLWYTYFLGAAAITLGMLDITTYRLKFSGIGRLSVAAILLAGLLLPQVLQGYYKLAAVAKVVNRRTLSTSDSDSQRIRDGLGAIQGVQGLLLRPYMEYYLGDAGWDHVADKGVLNERVMHVIPISLVVYRETILMARAGRQAEARALMEQAIWSYPGEFLASSLKLRALADVDTDPARFPALLEFALQKYEERQRIIHLNH